MIGNVALWIQWQHASVYFWDYIVEVCGMIIGRGSIEIVPLQIERRLVKLLYGFQYCFSTHALQ